MYVMYASICIAAAIVVSNKNIEKVKSGKCACKLLDTNQRDIMWSFVSRGEERSGRPKKINAVISGNKRK